MYLIVRGASLQDARTVAGIVKTTDRNIALDQIGMMDSRVDAPAAGLRVEAVTLACFCNGRSRGARRRNVLHGKPGAP